MKYWFQIFIYIVFIMGTILFIFLAAPVIMKLIGDWYLYLDKQGPWIK